MSKPRTTPSLPGSDGRLPKLRASPRKSQRSGRWNAINRPFTASPAPGPTVPINPTGLLPIPAVSTKIAKKIPLSKSHQRIVPGSIPSPIRGTRSGSSWEQVEQRRIAAKKSLEAMWDRYRHPSPETPVQGTTFPTQEETRIVPPSRPQLGRSNSKANISEIPRREEAVMVPKSRPMAERFSPRTTPPTTPCSVPAVRSASKRKTNDQVDDDEEIERWSSKRLRSRKTKRTLPDRSIRKPIPKVNPVNIEPEIIVIDYRESGGEYEVEQVIAEATGPGVHKYLIQWVGYQELDWIPAEDCFCQEKIDEFRNVPRTKFIVSKLADEEAEPGNEGRESVGWAGSKRDGRQLRLDRSGKTRNKKGQFASPRGMVQSESSEDEGSAQGGDHIEEISAQVPNCDATPPPKNSLGRMRMGRSQKPSDDLGTEAEEMEQQFMREGSIALPRSARSNTAILPSRSGRGMTSAAFIDGSELLERDIIHIRSKSVPKIHHSSSLLDGLERASTSSRENSEGLESNLCPDNVIDLVAEEESEAEKLQRQQNLASEAMIKQERLAENDRICQQALAEEARVREIEDARVHQQKLAEARRLLDEEERKQEALRQQTEKAEAEKEQQEWMDLLERVEESQDDINPQYTDVLEMIEDRQPTPQFIRASTVFKDEAVEETKMRERLASRDLQRRMNNAYAEKLCSSMQSPPNSSLQQCEVVGAGGQKLRQARSDEKERKRRKTARNPLRSEFQDAMSSKRAKRLVRLAGGMVLLRSIEVR